MSFTLDNASPLQKWLIGPIEHESIDLCLKKSFPAAHFFDSHSPLSDQYEPNAFEGILCIEPFHRLMPSDLWEILLPRVALAKKPPSGFSLSFDEDLWAPTLQHFNAWIPLDSVFDPTERAFLNHHHVEVTDQVWTFGSHHFQKQTAPLLFEHGWISPYAWQQRTEAERRILAQACPDLQYFLNSDASRIMFYFSKIQHIICPAPFQHPYLLQILAAGAQLWIPEEYQASTPQSLSNMIHTYKNIQSLAEQLKNYPTSPTRAGSAEDSVQDARQDLNPALASFTLNRVLPERLGALNKSQPKVAEKMLLPVSETTRLLHASGAHVLGILTQWLKNPEIQACSWYPLAECMVYLRFLLGDFIQVPQEKERIYRHVLGLSQRIPQKSAQVLCQYFVYKLRLNYHAADEAIVTLIDMTQNHTEEIQHEVHQILHYFLCMLQETIFLEITFSPEIAPEQSVQTWLQFQQAYLMAYTERQAEAASLLKSTRILATPPILGSLWCALGNYRASMVEAKGWKEAYPLHIWVGLKYIEALHLTQSPSQAMLAEELQHLKILCLCLNGSSHELEKILAYERLYCPTKALDNTIIQWEGPLYSYSSLAQINAYWLQALAQDQDYTPVHIPFEPPEQKKPVTDLQLTSQTAQTPAFFISHRWPPRLQPPEAGTWINIIPWEFGAIPQIWVERINAPEMQAVWVPSAYVAHSFWRSGVCPEKITVIPNGVDTQRFCPEGPGYPLTTQKRFCFLFVGGAIQRKGLDILIQAYTTAFSISDDVCLIIKTFGSDSHYALKSILPKLSSPNAPEIEYINQDLSPEDMASLYRRCQVYVHPYRGEGFAMPILEAMACGTPAIIPDAGPAPEFCSESAGWYVPTRITSDQALNIANQGVASVHAYFTTVDTAALAQQMQAAYHDTPAVKEKGAQAAKEALAYDWKRLYPRLKKQLQMPVQPPTVIPSSQSLPPRLYLENPWGLLPLQNTSEVQFVNDRVLAEQTLLYCLNPDDVQSLLGSLQQFAGSIALCATESLHDSLTQGGWPIDKTCIQPLMIDTQAFSPRVPPFRLEASAERFSFLLCFDWHKPGHWQDILTAYSAAFQSSDPVHLIFKPYNVAFEDCIESFMAWFESTGIAEECLPDITFMEEALIAEELPAFLRGVDCFIDNHSEPLALAAIASEVAVITGSTLPCLQRPAAEQYRFLAAPQPETQPKTQQGTQQGKSPPIHQASLIYLLRALVANPNPLQRRHAQQDLLTRQASSSWQQALFKRLQQTLSLQT